ncbi:MAG TPA: glycoside hydrolase family 43 protein [Cytophagales bacterium]|nr:glycoside hydrolase family 43 protein [Cytophagales bacterium]
MFRPFILIPFLALFILTGCSKKTTQVKTSGNPIFEGWYADPEGVILNNEYWIFPTYSARYESQVFLDAFSSKDLVEWEKHEKIIDTSRVKWAEKAMWAPCVVKKDSSYFLFFSANDIQTPGRKAWDPAVDGPGELGGIGIGIASNPGGPYEDYLKKPLINAVYNGAQPIDQFVFKDTDGAYYIIYGGWGHCNIGQLKEDFTGLKPFEDGSMVKEITPEGYVEGPVMFLRNGWYYLMWSEGNWGDGSYSVSYGRSKSLTGPFDKMATILESDTTIATGAGHHSVINIPNTDDWYIIYHRRPIPNQDRDHRVTCIDRMYFNEDGTIVPIKMTFEGVEAREIKENLND